MRTLWPCFGLLTILTYAMAECKRCLALSGAAWRFQALSGAVLRWLAAGWRLAGGWMRLRLGGRNDVKTYSKRACIGAAAWAGRDGTQAPWQADAMASGRLGKQARWHADAMARRRNGTQARWHADATACSRDCTQAPWQADATARGRHGEARMERSWRSIRRRMGGQ